MESTSKKKYLDDVPERPRRQSIRKQAGPKELDFESQQNELVALESILGEDVFIIQERAPCRAKIIINMEIGEDWTCKVIDYSKPLPPVDVNKSAVGDGGAVLNELEKNIQKPKYEEGFVKHLPPLVLHFTFPNDYPSAGEPIYTLESTFLDRSSLSLLCENLDSIWESTQEEIIYTWVNYLTKEAIYQLSSGTKNGKLELELRKKLTTSQKEYHRELNNRRNGIRVSDYTTDSTLMNCPGTASNKNKESVKKDAAGCSKTLTDFDSNSNSTNNHKNNMAHHKYMDSRAVLDTTLAREKGLIKYLVEFSEEQEILEFNNVPQSCVVCFSDKMGSEFIRLKCKHSFCKECLTSCYKTHITEGSVDSVKCLEHNCSEVPSSAQVRIAVGDELFNRYDSLLLNRALENMTDLIFCPRSQCMKPVIVDEDEKLATCSSCGYRFCSSCKMVYHGIEPCRFKSDEKEKLFKEYTEASKEERKAMEKTYGKRQLDVLVQSTLSERYIIKESKPCPNCRVPIEKSEGCNKVTCTKCGSFFCWLCSKQLDKANPYFHFQDPSSPCHNHLFNEDENSESDGSEEEEEYEDEDWSDQDEAEFNRLVLDIQNQRPNWRVLQ